MEQPSMTEEQEQLQQLNIFRKLIVSLICKYIWILISVFIIASCVTMFFIYRTIINSPTRYTAQTNLQYYPKSTKKVRAFDNQQVMQICTRSQMIPKLAEKLQLAPKDQATLGSRLLLRSELLKQNNIIITTTAATEEDAVNMANAFADLCIQEYVNLRTDDLNKWMESIQVRKAEITESMKVAEDKERQLTQDLGIMYPENEVNRLRTSIAQQKHSLNEINIQLANANARKKNVEQLLFGISPNLIVHVAEVKDYRNKLARIDNDLVRMKQLYTENNPRLLALLSQRKTIEDEYNAFLKEKDISAVHEEDIKLIEQSKGGVRELTVRIELLTESQTALKQDIEKDERQLQKISESLPQLQQLIQQRSSLQDSNKDLEKDIADINYLLTSIKNDLSQLERVNRALALQPFAFHNLLLALISGGILTGFLGALFVAWDLFFGKVGGPAEIQFYPQVTYLGAIPSVSPEQDLNHDERMLMDGLFYKFDQTNVSKKLIFLSVFKGAEYSKVLEEVLEWNYAVSGRRMMYLKLVPAAEYKEPVAESEGEQLGAVYVNGSTGTMPVENINALSPSEFMLLQNDLKELNQRFDSIIIYREKAVTTSGVFFTQMLKFCDSTLALLGSSRTSRSTMRYIIRQQKHTAKCIMMILTHVKDFSKETKGE